MRTQCTDSETCFYCQKSSQGLTQVIIDWQVHFPALTRHTIFYSLFMKCLVVWRIWIQILIIGTGFTEQLPRKNPFFIIFMPHIPLSEVGNRDAIHVCHGHSFICSLWRGLLTALVSVGRLKTHGLFRIPPVAPFLSVRWRTVGWSMCFECMEGCEIVLNWKETVSWKVIIYYTKACLKKFDVQMNTLIFLNLKKN